MSLITWDKAMTNPNGILSNGDLTIKNTQGSHSGTRATTGVLDGKWYWEIKSLESTTSLKGLGIGVCNSQEDTKIASIFAKNRVIYYTSGVGGVTVGGVSTQTQGLSAIGKDEIIGIKLDLTNKEMPILAFCRKGQEFYRYSSKEDVVLQGEIFPLGSVINSSCEANFGASPFKYEIPSGYLPYNFSQVNPIKALIKSNDKYYTLQNGEFIEVELTLDNFEKYGLTDLSQLTVSTDKVMLTMENPTAIGVGKAYSKKVSPIEWSRLIESMNVK